MKSYQKFARKGKTFFNTLNKIMPCGLKKICNACFFTVNMTVMPSIFQQNILFWLSYKVVYRRKNPSNELKIEN
jgi:hypothetical protein